ncbi:ethyl tert-butyl ether degradation EthD [Sphingobium sp. MI1205]|nr:ethyl tert-butyl ether degradation EthD [Sphingobium sp. MI1205]
MFKIMIFARRKAGLSREELMSIYEEEHIALTNDLVAQEKLPPMVDYRRNYIDHDSAMNVGAIDFDVVTEVWFEDQAGFEANRRGLSDPQVAQLVGEDMAKFLDLTDIRYVVVDERRGGGEAP